MHTGADNNTGAFSSADANADDSSSICAYVDTNSGAYNSTDPGAGHFTASASPAPAPAHR